MKYFKNKQNELFVDPIVENHAGLKELTKEQFDAQLVINNTPTQEQLDAIAKQEMQTALANLTVTTTAGNTFDGNDTARNNMLSALREGDNSDETETPFWILADNSKLVPCTYIELEEAHGLAIREKGAILAGG